MLRDLHPTLTELAADHGGLLRRAGLRAAGLSDHEIERLVRSGSLARVRRDAYRVGPSGDRLADFGTLLTLVRSRPAPAVIGGPAAVHLHGLPLTSPPATIHVCAPYTGGPTPNSLTRDIALPPRDQIVNLPSGPIASPARAVLDTARLQGVVAGVVAADAALRRRLATPEELRAVLLTMRGLHGVARARLCCELASPLSESPGESWSAVVMHQHGIATPGRQQELQDAAGLIGRVDFWWQRTRLVGEFDGRVKYGRANPSDRPPEDVLWEEKVREDRLRAVGNRVVRWTTADLRRPQPWLTRLRSALA